MIASAPFYWMNCDEDGCDARCPGPYDESVAWVSEDQAVACAEASDWLVNEPDGRHFCPDHAEDGADQ